MRHSGDISIGHCLFLILEKCVPLHPAKDELRSAKSETYKNQLASIIFCYNSKSMA